MWFLLACTQKIKRFKGQVITCKSVAYYVVQFLLFRFPFLQVLLVCLPNVEVLPDAKHTRLQRLQKDISTGTMDVKVIGQS